MRIRDIKYRTPSIVSVIGSLAFLIVSTVTLPITLRHYFKIPAIRAHLCSTGGINLSQKIWYDNNAEMLTIDYTYAVNGLTRRSRDDVIRKEIDDLQALKVYYLCDAPGESALDLSPNNRTRILSWLQFQIPFALFSITATLLMVRYLNRIRLLLLQGRIVIASIDESDPLRNKKSARVRYTVDGKAYTKIVSLEPEVSATTEGPVELLVLPSNPKVAETRSRVAYYMDRF